MKRLVAKARRSFLAALCLLTFTAASWPTGRAFADDSAAAVDELTGEGASSAYTPTEQDAARLEGEWEIAYTDALLGQVTGEATYNGQSVRITLTHPKTGEAHQLYSDDIAWRAANRVAFTLQGTSPSGPAESMPTADGLKRLTLGEAAEQMQLKSGVFESEHPVLAAGTVGEPNVVLSLTLTDDNQLAGEWLYLADLRTQRHRDGSGRVGRFERVRREGKLFGVQRGSTLWLKRKPRILATICTSDQLGAMDHGTPKYSYPWAPGSDDNVGLGRTLVIIGDNLPTVPGDAARLESADPHVSYQLAAAGGEAKSHVVYAQDVEKAWQRITQGLKASQIAALYSKDIVVVRARLSRGVVPGSKAFTLNGAAGDWMLGFGDATGRLDFVRQVAEGEYEATDQLFLPENFCLQVTTRVELPLEQVPLILGHNGRVAAVNGKPMLMARRVKDQPRVYRTVPIRLHKPGETVPDGRAALAASSTDELFARTGEDGLIRIAALAEQPSGPAAGPVQARANVFITPALLGDLWKEALQKAADCAGVEVDDWSTIGTQEAETVSNVILFDGEMYRVPLVGWDAGRPIADPKIERIRITIRDHAAMILLRDTFIQLMEAQLAEYERIQGPVMMRGFAAMVEPQVQNPRSAFNRIKVTAPDGRQIGFDAVFMLDWVGAYYKLPRTRVWTWRDKALQEGLDNLRRSMRESITRARETDICDVGAMLDITGFGYQAVVNHLLPRLMKLEEVGDPPRPQWAPDRVARAAVRGLHILGGAVRAQEEYSRADTHVVLAVASLVAMPLAAAEGALATGLALSVDVADIALVAAQEIPEFMRRRADVRFHEGASFLLGTGALDQARAREVSALELAVSIIGAGVGSAASSLDAIPKIRAALRDLPVDQLRAAGAKSVTGMGDGGLDAFRQLDLDQQAHVLAYMADARATRQAAGADALDSHQQQALALADRLEGEAQAARSAAGPPSAPEAPAVSAASAGPDPLGPSLDGMRLPRPARPDALDDAVDAAAVQPPRAADDVATPIADDTTGMSGALDDAVATPSTTTQPPDADLPDPAPVRTADNADDAGPASPGPDSAPPDTSAGSAAAAPPDAFDPPSVLYPSRPNPLDPGASRSVRGPDAPRPPPAAAAPSVRPPRPTAPTVRLPDPNAPTVRLPDPNAPTVRLPDPNAPTVRLPDPNAPTVRTPESGTPTVRLPDPDLPPAPSVRFPDPHRTTVLPPPDLPPSASRTWPTAANGSTPPAVGSRIDRPRIDTPQPDRFPPPGMPAADAPIAAAPAPPAALRDVTLEELSQTATSLDRQLAQARERLQRLEANAGSPQAIDAARAHRENLQQRRDILDDLRQQAEDGPAQLTDRDLDWLGGRQSRLTPDQVQQARRRVLQDFGGSWNDVTGDLLKTPAGRAELQRLVALRKQTVDQLLDEVMDDVAKLTGGPLERKAFGSTNLSSDYDLSISGPGAELVVIEFNRRFRRLHGGRESGSVFDTNVYTDPVYDFIEAQSPVGRNWTPPQHDQVRQFMYQHMAAAKYMNPAQWTRHMDALVEATPEAARPAMRRLLAEVETRERAARQVIARRLAQEPDTADPNTLLRVQNELYARSLQRIHDLRQLHRALDELANGRPAIVDLPADLRRSAVARNLARHQEMVRQGRTAEAAALVDDMRARVAQQLRHNQGNALYFASEAYQTQGTIRHVVGELQAGGRGKTLTPEALKAPPAGAPLPPGQYAASFNENFANLSKELNHLGILDGPRLSAGVDAAKARKAATKTAKYFIRQLDAAHRAGVNLVDVLPPRLHRLIDDTIALDKARSDPDAFLAALRDRGVAPDSYVNDALEASELLTRAVHQHSPVSDLMPALQKHYDELDAELAEFETPLPIPPAAPSVAGTAGDPPAVRSSSADVETAVATVGPPRARTIDAGPAAAVNPQPAAAAADLPQANALWRGPAGVELRLGRHVGSGRFADVYELADRPDEVVKFIHRGDGGEFPGARTAAGIAQDAARISDLLEQRGIRQLEVLKVGVDDAAPYVIARKLPVDAQVLDPAALKPLNRDRLIAEGRWSTQHERAVLELFYDLARKNLVWEDAHLGNIYFEQVDGRLVAGILDHDRLADFEAIPKYLKNWRELMELQPRPYGIRSNIGRRLGSYTMDSAAHFMAKMLEHKGWIRFNEQTGRFEPGLIDPDLIDRELFPIEDWVNPQLLPPGAEPNARRPARASSQLRLAA